MKANQILNELEDIRLRVYRLRTRNKQCPWLCHALKAIEVLVFAAWRSVDHVTKITK